MDLVNRHPVLDGQELGEAVRPRADRGDAQVLAGEVGRRLQRVGRFGGHHLRLARRDQRLKHVDHRLLETGQVDGMIVGAERDLDLAHQQRVLGALSGRLVHQRHVDALRVIQAELLG